MRDRGKVATRGAEKRRPERYTIYSDGEGESAVASMRSWQKQSVADVAARLEPARTKTKDGKSRSSSEQACRMLNTYLSYLREEV